MSHIVTSLYIPRIEKIFNAKYVTEIFEKNGIAYLSNVCFEPCEKSNLYNNAYIKIDKWADTETAYSFIQRLRDNSLEARIVHGGDDWWAVYINSNPAKLTSNRSSNAFSQQKQLKQNYRSKIAVRNANDLDAFLKKIDYKTVERFIELLNG
jgi:hypothetical protein